jgi:ATP-dependent DNA helicase RecQ
MLPGITVVVSPLISLMKDQVESLQANGVAAEFLNSSLSKQAAIKVTERLQQGKVKLVYVAPERLLTTGFMELLKRFDVNLFVIDEAHCISVWGHSFRKEYTQLRKLRDDFPKVPMMALTATADEMTREDIVEQLQLQRVRRYIASFDRPNIKLAVLPAKNRAQVIVDLVRERQDQAGIVYCLSRKETEKMSQRLKEAGIAADFYHAEVEAKERSRRQEAFVKDDIQVICATVAFGMGIDKSNVRYVIHHNMPPNIESYYQEIGRAGRDGLASEAVLFYSISDVMQWRRMLSADDLGEHEREVKLKKLLEMQRWVEGLTCRRKMGLEYFGEQVKDECGNCDVCMEPPEEFDGSQVAQKALSVLARVKKPLSFGVMIGILRGSKAQYIREPGYDRIKTHGIGKDVSAPAWRQYLKQLMEQRLIYYERNRRGWWMTPEGERVLYGKHKVQLKRSPLVNVGTNVRERVKKRVEVTNYDEGLFERLRQLRKRLADTQGVPAYIVFSDATLKEIAVVKPANKIEMLAVSGVGETKWERYGKEFIDEIGRS